MGWLCGLFFFLVVNISSSIACSVKGKVVHGYLAQPDTDIILIGSEGHRFSTRTDAAGRFELRDIRPDTYTFIANRETSSYPKRNIQQLKLAPCLGKELEISLETDMLPEAVPTPITEMPMGIKNAHLMVLYAYQDSGNSIGNSHVFAAFTKIKKLEDNLTNKIVLHTISWIPPTADICTLCTSPEPGKNFNLRETLDIAKARNLYAYYRGPYVIHKDLYDRALARIHFLNSGNVFYKVIDSAWRLLTFNGQFGGAVNCIHSVSDLGGFLETGTAHGSDAMDMVWRHLSPWYMNPYQTHPWLLKKIGS